MNANLEAALAYAEKGLAIFPVKGKIPATKAGFKDATYDIEQVTKWWTEHPTWGIGCPVPEGYVVIDVDMKNGGFASLAALEEETGAPIPETRTAYTGGGGLHLWYAYEGNDLRQGAGLLGPGIDTRVPGKGYVVMPPSIHPETDKAYEWADRQPFVALPEWMAEKLRVPASKPKLGISTDNPSFDDADRKHAYTRLAGMADKMRAAVPGTRNPLLNNLAYTAGRLIPYGLDHQYAYDELYEAAHDAGLEEIEIGLTLDSGLTAGYEAGPDPEHHAPSIPHPIILPNTQVNLKVAETITRNPKGTVEFEPDRSLDVTLSKEFEELRWTVEDLVPEGLTLLCGTTKVGKSFFSLLMALKVAAGKPFLGLDTSGGTVLYIHLEDGDRRMQKRARDFGADDLPHMDRFYHYMNWPAWPEGLAALDQWMTDHPSTQLIVIDTVGKLRPPGSGKDPYAADYLLYGGLQTWAVEKRVALIGVHHTNKSVSKDHQDRISGTRGVAGAADTTLMLDRIEGTKDGRLASVGRDGPQLDLALQFGENGLWSNEGEYWQWKIQSEHSEVLAAIRAAGGTATLEEIVQAVGGSKQSVSNRVGRMLTKGAITRPKHGTYGLPAFARKPEDPTLGI